MFIVPLIVLAWLFASQVSALSQTEAHSYNTITWGPCPETLPAPGLKCAKLLVPLDWDHPDGEKIELGMAKLPAQDPENRIGSLFINPGGPGYPATKEVSDIGLGTNGYTGDEIKRRFDIIGLDPRGVGLSTRVRCDLDLWNRRMSLFPTNEASFRWMVQFYQEVSANCRNLTGPLMDHLDTIQVVKDLEAVRVALGNEKINWLGMSYGTMIGTQYAYLYPKNIRSMILDSNLQHYQDEASMLLSEATTYEATLMRFFNWCETANRTTCVLSGQNIAEIWNELLVTAAKMPIPAPRCGTMCRANVNAEEIRFGAQVLLFNASAWSTLGSAIHNATKGDATALSTYLATGDAFGDSMLFAFLATICNDFPTERKSFAHLQAKQIEAAVFAPLTRGASAAYMVQSACIGWRHRNNNPPQMTQIKGAPKVLVVNGIYDPSTSYAWAMGVSGQFVNLTVPAPGTVLNS
ncbi:hypothetical protein BHE90_001372 [Fusarium euwallaceae]|uniref:AB hydrolase-1 domain-containing protein n=1 Tax=Fusarium euwallaceae TaxID=1147111 RepID=A0A430M7T3_9HYPO|nr:hypothetical protein BHE90_001372 [Fusarium euwallaceae]